MTPEMKEKLRQGRADARARKAAAVESAPADEALLRQPVTVLDEPDDSRRRRLLDGVPADIAALITDAELEKIESEERQRAEIERKTKALASVREQLRQQARVDNDLISADVLLSDAEKARLSEKVKFRINLPAGGAGHRGHHGFRVNGFTYQQGREYEAPRAVFESLQANHYKAWLSETRFKTLDQHKRGNSAEEILNHQPPHFEVMA